MTHDIDGARRGTELRPYADFEGMTFTSGWYVIRDQRTRGQDGQWLASRDPVTVRR